MSDEIKKRNVLYIFNLMFTAYVYNIGRGMEPYGISSIFFTQQVIRDHNVSGDKRG